MCIWQKVATVWLQAQFGKLMSAVYSLEILEELEHLKT